MKPELKALGITFVALIGCMILPAVVLGSAGFTALATTALFGAMSGSVVSLTSSERVSLLMALPLAAASALAVIVADSPWLAALLMAVVAGARGFTASSGLSGALTTPTIAVGFLVAQPPTLHESLPTWSIVGMTVLLCALWATLVILLLRHYLVAVPKTPGIPPVRARVFALISALMMGVAAWCVAEFHLGHAGGWLLLTIVVVFQPYVKDAFVKALHRAGGTFLGFIIAFVVGTLTQSAVLLSLLGFVAMSLSVGVMALGRPYWQYATFLTTAIVLFAGATSSVYEMDGLRLVATLLGVAFVLLVTALIQPFAKRSALVGGYTHY